MKIKYILPSAIVTLLLSAGKALAFCPVCVVAVGAGVGLSRYLKIDDTITGLWIGGLLVAMSGWTINYLEKKKVNFVGIKILVVAAYYTLVCAPLYRNEIIGHPLNKFWGVDKLMLGIAIGSVFLLGGDLLYHYLKKKNGGHAHFPFEKIVFPVAPLIILSVIFYFLTKG